MGFFVDRRALWASIAVAGLIVVPLMLNVPLYFDDLGRSLSGSYGWSEDGRPLADAVSQLLLLGAPRTVLNSPLGLLICVPLMALGSCLLARILQHPRFWGAPLACVFLFGSPYFIENLSYGFDAPQMVLAVLLNLWAAWLTLKRVTVAPMLLAVTLVLAGLCLYQPAHAAFWIPVLLALVFPDRTAPDPSPAPIRSGPVLLRSLGVLAAALLLYRGVVLPMVQLDAYADNFDAVPGLLAIPGTLVGNLNQVLARFEADWWDSALAELLLGFVLLTGVVSARRGSASWPEALARLLVVPLVLIGSTGAALLLKQAILPPRALIGVGVVFACLALTASRGWSASPRGLLPGRVAQWTVIAVVLAMGWGCLSLVYFYGQAHAAQQRMNRNLMVAVVRDLRGGGYGPGDLQQLQIVGRSALAPITRNTLRSYPHLSQMIRPIVPIQADWQGHVRFKQFGFKPMKPREAPADQVPDWSLRRPLYDLDVRGEHLTVHFKDEDLG